MRLAIGTRIITIGNGLYHVIIMSTELPKVASSGYPPVEGNQANTKKVSETLVDSPTTTAAKQSDAIAQLLQVDNPSLQFSLDQTSGKMVVKVTDKQTGELLRQIPSEDMLKIAESLDQLRGLFIDEKA